jgi:hypothetical protein
MLISEDRESQLRAEIKVPLNMRRTRWSEEEET